MFFVYFFFFFFFTDTATTEIYTLSLHDALPTWVAVVLWLRSQASRQAIPGSLPQLPVSVPGTLATVKPVAWNTELLPTGATPREATGGVGPQGGASRRTLRSVSRSVTVRSPCVR